MVRLKHRYLLVNILYPQPSDASKGSEFKAHDEEPYTLQFHQPSPDRVDAKLLLSMIRTGVSELFGDYGSGMIAGSLQVKYFSPATSTAIIRVSRDHYRLVWAALTFVTHLLKPVGMPCVMQVVRVSGTIKKAEMEAIRRARLSIRRAKTFSTAGSALALGTDVESEDVLRFADEIEDVEDGDEDEDEGSE